MESAGSEHPGLGPGDFFASAMELNESFIFLPPPRRTVSSSPRGAVQPARTGIG